MNISESLVGPPADPQRHEVPDHQGARHHGGCRVSRQERRAADVCWCRSPKRCSMTSTSTMRDASATPQFDAGASRQSHAGDLDRRAPQRLRDHDVAELARPIDAQQQLRARPRAADRSSPQMLRTGLRFTATMMSPGRSPRAPRDAVGGDVGYQHARTGRRIVFAAEVLQRQRRSGARRCARRRSARDSRPRGRS